MLKKKKNVASGKAVADVKFLREKLLAVFEEQSDLELDAAQESCDGLAGIMGEEILAAYNRVWDSLVSALNVLVRGEGIPNFDGDFYDDLSKVLLWKSYVSCKPWKCRDCTDEEILAARKAILQEDIDALDCFRDDNEEAQHWFPCTQDVNKQLVLVGNLRYFAFALAHLAKHYGADDVGRVLLRLVSDFAQMKHKDVCVMTTAADVENSVDGFRSALDELRVAADYAGLKDWKKFRAEALKSWPWKRRSSGKGES